ncbi:hypothetical protein HanHA300_Chr17g0650701 [Helianthus annuus]|nr:hypothetical protein HanHA300_Chr17g0650701 [Helianthus annuus]KAJ0824025.1 hypothetical protein HanLR1_Chr00c0098g0709651 [Helianthus annuus]
MMVSDDDGLLPLPLSLFLVSTVSLSHRSLSLSSLYEMWWWRW